MLRDKLIKLLGGFTFESEYFVKFAKEIQNRVYADFLGKEQWYRDQIKEKDQEIRRLNDIFLEKYGFIKGGDLPAAVEKELKPVSRGNNSSWPERKKRLENEAFLKANSERLEKQYEGRVVKTENDQELSKDLELLENEDN